MQWIMVSMVALGGALGAVARYGMVVGAARWLGAGFPWGTLAVNVLGSFLMGVLAGMFARDVPVPQEIRVFLTAGVLGGFTTFSAFSLDAVLLAERGEMGAAAAYVLASVLLSIGLLLAGLMLARYV